MFELWRHKIEIREFKEHISVMFENFLRNLPNVFWRRLSVGGASVSVYLNRCQKVVKHEHILKLQIFFNEKRLSLDPRLLSLLLLRKLSPMTDMQRLIELFAV